MPSKHVSEILSYFVQSHPKIRCIYNHLDGVKENLNIIYKNYYPDSDGSIIFELSNDKKIYCNDLEFAFIKQDEIQLGNYSFCLN